MIRIPERLRFWRRGGKILESYVSTAPGPQNALDIFKGEWASRMPEPYTSLEAGIVPLFEDSRITWASDILGGLREKTVLDLGPLEGGHPYMFEQMGAKEVVSVEGNQRAFQKCLITKELLGLERVRYMCGDFMEFLRENEKRFDVVNACGVLYHQRNPVELLGLLAKAGDAVILWTHYYDQDVIASKTELALTFGPAVTSTHDGFEHELHRHYYGRSLRQMSFCGGNAPYANWMTRDGILAALTRYGLGDVQISSADDDPQHLNGPAFALVAQRARSD